MLVSDFNYELPEARIAKFPPKTRGSTRLLKLDRKTGSLQDAFYSDLVDFLNPGDVLILNNTRVMRSRIFTELPDGRRRELVVLEKHGDEPQKVMYRGKLHEGDRLMIVVSQKDNDSNSREQEESDVSKELKTGEAPKIVVKKILGGGIAEIESMVTLPDLVKKYGTVPLPPYLHRDATEADDERYQTVWAEKMGSAAAPTASLNMTEDLLKRLEEKGVAVKYLTLHVGLGTFLPIRSDKVEDHVMHSEWFEIPPETVDAIKKAQDSNRSRVIALGTTVARTLEYYAKTGKTSGEDDIFIYPGFEFRIVDALITNFHAPKSTVLMLAAAFAGWGNLKKAYDHAVGAGYNFLSYGDSMLIC